MDWGVPGSNMEINLENWENEPGEKMHMPTIMEIEKQKKIDFKKSLYFGHWPKMAGLLGLVGWTDLRTLNGNLGINIFISILWNPEEFGRPTGLLFFFLSLYEFSSFIEV